MVITDILIEEDAIYDLKQGKAFYSTESPELGEYFRQSLIDDVATLKIHGGVHTKHFGYYRKLASVFPYGIYYYIKETVVHVIAIFPMKRDPQWLQANLLSRH